MGVRLREGILDVELWLRLLTPSTQRSTGMAPTRARGRVRRVLMDGVRGLAE
jgi:hypothetical protein